jgi:hypothetical protein
MTFAVRHTAEPLLQLYHGVLDLRNKKRPNGEKVRPAGAKCGVNGEKIKMGWLPLATSPFLSSFYRP